MVLVEVLLEASPQPPSPSPRRVHRLRWSGTGIRTPTPRFSMQVQDFAAWREKSGVRGHTVPRTPSDPSVLSGACWRQAGGLLHQGRRRPVPYADAGAPRAGWQSPADRDRSAAEIIARAKATGAKRVTPKTAKRHLSVLSRFFKFCLDKGLISKALRDELTEEHEFAGGAAPADNSATLGNRRGYRRSSVPGTDRLPSFLPITRRDSW